MNNYIIVNKDTIQKRIDELYRESRNQDKINKQYSNILTHKAFSLEEILSESTPLRQEIENIFDELNPYISFNDLEDSKQHYISNLKLDI